MYALCVSSAVNTQGFVWKFLCVIYLFIFIHSFIQSFIQSIVMCLLTLSNTQPDVFTSFLSVQSLFITAFITVSVVILILVPIT